jgi:hypothetical protein
VSGRSDALRQAGFAGNFSVAEALALCAAAGVRAMIAHHYGMFAFNTVEPAAIDAALEAAPVRALRARTQAAWTLLSD